MSLRDLGASPAELLQLSQRCARQVSFSWSPTDGGLHFGDEVDEFLAPGLLSGVRSGAELMARIEPEDQSRFHDAIIAMLKGGDASRRGVHESLFRLRSGVDQIHWIAMRGNVTAVDADGRGLRVSGVLVDETERETERRDAIRMRDLYAMLSAVNRAIAQAADRPALLAQVCQAAVLHGRFALCWAGLGDVAAGTVKVVAQAGAPEDYPLRVTRHTGAGRLQGGGLSGRVMRERCAVIENDVAHPAEPSDWATYAAAAGFRGIGCFPLFEHGEPVGSLVLYAHEAHHFDAAMVALLEGLCADVSRALDHLLAAQRQAQRDRELQQATRHFQIAMLTSLDGMLVIEGDGRITDMNPAARTLLFGEDGLSAPGRLSNLVGDFTPARYRPARKTQIQRLLNAGDGRDAGTRRIETFVCRHDGSEVPVEMVFTPLGSDRSSRLMVMLRDLTALLRQREQLIDSARRFEQLIEHAPDGMLVHIKGEILLCNSRLREMLACSHSQDLHGLNLRLIVHPESHAGHDKRMRRVLDGENVREMGEISLLALNGRKVECDFLATDTEFHGRKARQVVFRDIGDRKHLERRQASQQAVLSLIAERQPLGTVLFEVAVAIERHTPGAHCAVFVVGDDGASFCGGYSPSLRVDPLRPEADYLIGEDNPRLIARAVVTGAPVVVEDLRQHPAPRRMRAEHRALGARAAAAWPLMSRSGSVMGAIYLTLPETGQPSRQVLQLVGEYSDLTAVAIDNDRQAAQVRHLAQHDVLTGLPNRALFKELLDGALARAQRRGSQLAALFVDLDGFKQINDGFGHDTGDDVLREVSRRLGATIRAGDRAARMGGDEFYVLADDVESPDAAGQMAQRVLDALAEPMLVDGQEHQLSASIGIALYPRDGASSEELLKHADIAMYRAKNAGRAGYSFFAESDNVDSRERFAIQSQLRQALQRREFVLHFQPRVDLPTGRICGVEALVRWQHPERGLLMPGHFIEVAEDSGLIRALGTQIMEMGFAAAPQLARAAGGGFRTAINLSAVQLSADGFVDEVRRLAQRLDVDPRLIEFEITESVLMRRPEQARATIEELRAMGFEFSIDDFGTDYSSLTYLKRFPVQCVKVDRSFVKDIPDDSSDLAITRAIVAMADSLSLKVVAEGVETPEQLNALRQMGCDQYQGYYFSKPVTLDRVLALLQVPAVG